jgi:MYXO-CTERM domain-containing protein
VIDRDGHVVIHETTEPVYELYYPYLPGMVVFGFSSSAGGSKTVARLTDARIQFLVFTGLVTLIALSRIRPPSDARFRALQALTVLPTAALPLSTGGDDMPVAALMLLGLVALQRRRPVLAGLALGAASSLKFTAWPLVVLALWAVTDLQRRRAVGRFVIGPAEPLGVRRQRDPLPAGAGRRGVPGGQRPARP